MTTRVMILRDGVATVTQETHEETPQLEETTKRLLGKLVAKTLIEYFKDKEHRRAYEDWYFEQYGVKYQWKFWHFDDKGAHR